MTYPPDLEDAFRTEFIKRLSPYQQWCADRGVAHAHCPKCSPLNEHPQPFVADDGTLLCGRCAFGCERTEMLPCTPVNCDDAREGSVSCEPTAPAGLVTVNCPPEDAEAKSWVVVEQERV